MILGNSRNNQSQIPRAQYLTKKRKQEMTPTEKGLELGAQYNRWFSENYEAITKELKGNYTQDAISESYIKIYESIIYREELPKNLLQYTVRAIYTNQFQMKMAEQKRKYKEFSISNSGQLKDSWLADILPDTRDAQMQEQVEYEAQLKALLDEIIDYLFDVLPLEEASLYRLYINLKPAYSIAQVARVTGLGLQRAKEIVEKAKAAIKLNSNLYAKYIKIIGITKKDEISQNIEKLF